ncbi:MAG: hypothetical protein KAY50_00585 [Chitinophagaceae bacterium]|nr:hypothetical protein [Chitinophagaceae bacterium]
MTPRGEDKPPFTLSNSFLGTLIIAIFIMVVPASISIIRLQEFVRMSLEQHEKDIDELQKQQKELRDIVYPKPSQYRQN